MQTELIDDDSPEAPVVNEKSEKAESSSVSFEKKKGKKVEDLEVKDAQMIFQTVWHELEQDVGTDCLLYTSPSPRDVEESRMPSSA